MFFPDGTATFYENSLRTVDSKCVWTYGKDQVRWYWNKGNCVLFADVNNENVRELFFEGDSWKWKNENYKKVSDEAEKLSAHEYDELIRETNSDMGAEDMDAYDTEEMSAADLAYYLEVTARCTQKMLSVYSSYLGN